MKYKGLNEVGAKVINWLSKNSKNGISGDPLNWKEYDHKQTKLLI
jgi:hypothetical protein